MSTAPPLPAHRPVRLGRGRAFRLARPFSPAHEHLLCFGDQANVPYGSRSLEERAPSPKLPPVLLSQGKLIVIACNTASAAALKHLRAVFKVPFVGMGRPSSPPRSGPLAQGRCWPRLPPSTAAVRVGGGALRAGREIFSPLPGLVGPSSAPEHAQNRRILEEAVLPMLAAGARYAGDGTRTTLRDTLIEEIAAGPR